MYFLSLYLKACLVSERKLKHSNILLMEVDTGKHTLHLLFIRCASQQNQTPTSTKFFLLEKNVGRGRRDKKSTNSNYLKFLVFPFIIDTVQNKIISNFIQVSTKCFRVTLGGLIYFCGCYCCCCCY